MRLKKSLSKENLVERGDGEPGREHRSISQREREEDKGEGVEGRAALGPGGRGFQNHGLLVLEREEVSGIIPRKPQPNEPFASGVGAEATARGVERSSRSEELPGESGSAPRAAATVYHQQRFLGEQLHAGSRTVVGIRPAVRQL